LLPLILFAGPGFTGCRGPGSETPPVETGKPAIEIAFTPPQETQETVAISADSTEGLSRERKDTLTLSVNAEPPARWFIDGEERDETGAALTIAAADYPVGIHHAAVLVYKDGLPWSDELTFTVIK
jgi:hypothetical protein